MRNFFLVALLSVVGYASAVSSAPEDWPHLRGPGYDGISNESELAQAWPENGPPVLWSRELGQGYSGFIVAQGKIYTQRQTPDGQYLICLDPDTGETVWEYRYDRAWRPREPLPGPYATPTYAAGKVFYTSPTGLLGCVDARSGEPLWSLDVLAQFKTRKYDYGYAATPLIEDNKIILPLGNGPPSLGALHTDDGRTLWAVDEDMASYSSVLPITFQGRRCVVGYLQNAVIVADLKTGRLLGRQSFSKGYDEHSAWPLYREPQLFLAAPFRKPARLLELSTDRPAGSKDSPNAGDLSVKTLWTSEDFCNDVVSSVLYKDHIYGFDIEDNQSNPRKPSLGSFKCVDWSSAATKWSTDRVGHVGLIVADGKLILLNDSGHLILAAADPKEYRELGRVCLFNKSICWTPPTLWNGRLFVRGAGRAVCLFLGRHEKLGPKVAVSEVPPSGWSSDLPSDLDPAERDHSSDVPSWNDMAQWFGACILFVFGPAALLAAVVPLLFRSVRFSPSTFPPFLLFWFFAFVLGFLATNPTSAFANGGLFTWPACLYIVFHLTVQMCLWAVMHPQIRWAKWAASGTVLGLVLVGCGYFVLCKVVGLFSAWFFLVGFLPALGITAWAAWLHLKGKPAWQWGAWTLLAFAVFFWTAQGLFLWTGHLAVINVALP